MIRFLRSPTYLRLRTMLGGLYVIMGTIIVVRTCLPLQAMSMAKIPGLVLGAAIVGLGIVRIRDFILMRGGAST